MKAFQAWHAWLIPIPIVGWLLLLGYFLDSRLREPQPAKPPCSLRAARGQRLAASALDAALLLLPLALLPPALAWLLAAVYLLFRDTGLGLGKRALGLCVLDGRASSLSFSTSLARNLPLLVPYLGPLVEIGLVIMGRPRLGDRLAGTDVWQRARKP